jgi:hypothetical protein
VACLEGVGDGNGRWKGVSERSLQLKVVGQCKLFVNFTSFMEVQNHVANDRTELDSFSSCVS